MHELDERIARRVDRFHRFYRSNRPGDLLIVNRPSWPIKKNLFEYDYDNGGHIAEAADYLAGTRRLLDMSGGLDDDFIPYFAPDFGIAVHHAFVIDVPIQFAEWTSWGPHPLEGPGGWDKLDRVRYDRDNKWVRRMIEQHQYFVANEGGWALPVTFLHYSPLDLANALRGNDLLYDFYDTPDRVHALLAGCTEAVAGLERELRAIVGEHLDRYGLPFWGALGPRGSMFLSEDLMDMCGPDIAAKWGLPYTLGLREQFGSISVHHHMLGGAKVQRVIGREVQDAVIQISNDPNCPPSADCLLELHQAAGANALMVDMAVPDIEKHIDELRQIRAIIVTMCGDAAKARRAVELVRSVSNIS